MEGVTGKKCYMAQWLTRAPHPGVIRPLEYEGKVEYYCESCYAERAEAVAADMARKADPAKNPLSDDELEAAVRGLGNLTGAQLGEINRRLIWDDGLSAAQRQVWGRVLEDHNARVLARGEALIKDLVIGASYRVRYWDPDRMPLSGGGSLNLAANALSAGAAAVQNISRGFHGDVLTGELAAKGPGAVTIRTTRRSILGSKTYETLIWTNTIASIEPA